MELSFPTPTVVQCDLRKADMRIHRAARTQVSSLLERRKKNVDHLVHRLVLRDRAPRLCKASDTCMRDIHRAVIIII